MLTTGFLAAAVTITVLGWFLVRRRLGGADRNTIADHGRTREVLAGLADHGSEVPRSPRRRRDVPVERVARRRPSMRRRAGPRGRGSARRPSDDAFPSRRTVVAVAVAGALVSAWVLIDGAADAPQHTASGPAEATTTTPATTAPPTTEAPPAPVPELPALLAPEVVDVGSTTFVVPVPFELELVAVDLCWVQVVTDTGETLLLETLEAGEQRVVTGAGALSLRLGNSAGLVIAADGAILDHPATPGQPSTVLIEPAAVPA